MSIQVTGTTPTQDVITNRVALVRLAQVVFEREEMAATRAFSHFRKNEDIARIIDAKRGGVFDYGQHIKKTDTGYTYPSADETLKMLDEAEKRASGGGEPAPEPQQAPADPPKRRGRPQKAAEPSNGAATESAPATGLDSASLAELRDNLSAAFTTLDNRVTGRVDGLRQDLINLALGVRGLVGLIEVMMDRQKLVQDYFDPHAEIPQVSEAVKKDLMALVHIVPIDQAPAEKVEAKEPEKPGTEIAPPPKQEPAAPAQHETVEITKEALEAMELPALRELAKKIGVPDCEKAAFKTVLILRILKHAQQ